MEKKDRIDNLYKVKEKINDCMALVYEATEGTKGQDFVRDPIMGSLTISMERVTKAIQVADPDNWRDN